MASAFRTRHMPYGTLWTQRFKRAEHDTLMSYA